MSVWRRLVESYPSARRSGGPRVSALPAVAVLLALYAGCAAPLPQPVAIEPEVDDRWPARITAHLDALDATVPDTLPAVESAVETDEGGVSEARAAVRVVGHRVADRGIVAELGASSNDSDGPIELVFVSFSPLVYADGDAADHDDPSAATSNEPREALPELISWAEIDAGVRWELFLPREGTAEKLAVHLGGNKYVRRSLLDDGWAVLTSAGTGRYTERLKHPTEYTLAIGSDHVAFAEGLARRFDDELADWPYSLEAVLAYLAETRPAVPQSPLAVMGFSIGALGLPTVAARLGERIDAAVLVAGGANLLRISQTSTKYNGGVVIGWTGGEATADDWNRLYDAYLAAARLDPYHTAEALHGIPTLVYHAHFDQVVPADTGETFYERLGRPERRTVPLGHHQILRIVMRLSAGEIAAWADEALKAAASAPALLEPTDR